MADDRLTELCDTHSRDITLMLVRLTAKGLLEKRGTGRGTTYSIGKADGGTPLFPKHDPAIGSEQFADSLQQSSVSSEQSSASSEQSSVSSEQIADQPQSKRSWQRREMVEDSILEECSHQFKTTNQLALLLARSPLTIRTHYIKKLLQEGRLELRFPEKKNHPQQAYRTKEKE